MKILKKMQLTDYTFPKFIGMDSPSDLEPGRGLVCKHCFNVRSAPCHFE